MCLQAMAPSAGSDAFVKSHFARSAPALVVVGNSNQLKVLELEGELNLHLESYNPLTHYDFPYISIFGRIRIFFNGFLVIRVGDKLWVCNPITREVIKLDVPSDLPTDPQQSAREVSALGFGASKVVCIKRRSYHDKLECHVYTLGTGSWRRLEGNPYVYQFGLSGAFVNGNLHWIATIGEDSSWISCFDLETECFSFFKAPPYHARRFPFTKGTSISALSGCLWFCKVASEFLNSGGRWELTIWIMKEYGVDESWSMEYVIRLHDSMRPYYPCRGDL
ncbi:F-box/kelch-repeat protein At3g23880-like isoform X3 [Salvia miltiorrhiza]|uniref:F-box/kelch-repeat protein At3g23880-like isoform X3 n=1 Tax=Salvia miltiorrhiza TaxID=226208 RepID=UPI0025AD771E|nr:F-box/kelch-repeat protein At3g23880-like isoform X3 [Salvia miltiorrhiza]